MANLFTSFAGRLGMSPKEAERFFKFLAVGTLGFVIDFGMLTLLVELFHVPERVASLTGLPETVGLVLANTVSFTLAVLSNFSFNRYWTYPESRSKRKRVQLPQFTLVSVIGLLLNNAILALLHTPFDRLMVAVSFFPGRINGYIPAKVVATIVVLFWNFFVNRYWTYSNVE
ncbi:MAG: GtrA family protein [Chloroflexi bacterium]|nr:GtrA family protein [Chloroflexota bacterium]MCI0580334.1 GtrA family protein [Chloroflexota bacterium]MCI0648519.1 GtrA family protein [Chloroflexota bacterium]MCI0728501.1 GtrA family protein [Chloroflexota bacterium]